MQITLNCRKINKGSSPTNMCTSQSLHDVEFENGLFELRGRVILNVRAKKKESENIRIRFQSKLIDHSK